MTLDPTKWAGHTPGPWVALQEFSNRWRIEVPRGGCVPIGVGLACTTILEVGCNDTDTVKNAHLMASAPEIEAERVRLEAENERLRKALEFYANPQVFKPHPHGIAFDRRGDLYLHARAALGGTP